MIEAGIAPLWTSTVLIFTVYAYTTCSAALLRHSLRLKSTRVRTWMLNLVFSIFLAIALALFVLYWYVRTSTS